MILGVPVSVGAAELPTVPPVGPHPDRWLLRAAPVESTPDGTPTVWPVVGAGTTSALLGMRLPSVPVVPGVPLVEGMLEDCPGVGAGAGPVPLGIRLSVVPVPGTPAFDGIVVDCPGVGAGAGPVPLGAVLPDEPDVPDDAPPALPLLPPL
jgi:hypothetical protein